MWRRIFAIIRREYLERVRTKAFWISTLLVPLFMVGVMVVPAYFASRGGGEFDVAVLDFTGRFFDPVLAEVEGALERPENANISVSFTEIDPGSNPEAVRDQIKQRVKDQEFEGVLVFPLGLPDEGQPEYLAPNVAAFRLLIILEIAVNKVMVADRLVGVGVDPDRVYELTERVDLKTLKLGEKGQETHDQGQMFILSYVLVFAIYMSVLLYGMYVMRGVLEEKSSHIVEVIISAVKPFELMLGKILGIGAVGLTQFFMWSAMVAALSAPGALVAVGLGGLDLPTVPVFQIILFLVYFVLGFLLYGTLYAGIGAAFDTEQEAQNFQSVVTIVLIIPMMLMMIIFNDPDGSLAVSMSLVPFFAPVLMTLRLTLTSVPMLQVVGSILLMVATIVAASWVVGKIYRVGILMHGTKPKLKDLMRWVREA